MITFNKPPSDKQPPDTFSDKHNFEPGSMEAASFDKSCREARRAALLSSDEPFTADDVAFLKGGSDAQS